MSTFSWEENFSRSAPSESSQLTAALSSSLNYSRMKDWKKIWQFVYSLPLLRDVPLPEESESSSQMILFEQQAISLRMAPLNASWLEKFIADRQLAGASGGGGAQVSRSQGDC